MNNAELAAYLADMYRTEGEHLFAKQVARYHNRAQMHQRFVNPECVW